MENEFKENEVQVNEGMKAPRHGFVTFWLWLGVVVGAFAAIIAISGLANDAETSKRAMEMAASSEMSYQSIYNQMTITMVITLIICLVQTFAYALLLGRKKLGFKLMVYAAAAYIIWSVIQGFMLGGNIKGIMLLLVAYIIGFAISLAILYGILHIRKDGISYWSQLR